MSICFQLPVFRRSFLPPFSGSKKSKKHIYIYIYIYRVADRSLVRPGRKNATAAEDMRFIYPIYNDNWRNVSGIYIYKTRLASKEIF